MAGQTSYAPGTGDSIQRITPSLQPAPRPWWMRPASYVFFAALGFGLLWLLRPVITPIFAALACAYFVNPVVDSMEKRGVPRSVTILGILVFLTAALGAVIALVIPLVQHEITLLFANVPGYWDRLNDWFLTDVRPWVKERFGRDLPTTPQQVWEQAGGKLSGAAPDIAGWITSAVTTALSNIFGLLGALVSVLLFPVFFFYLAKDFTRLKAATVDLIPPRHRDVLLSRLGEVDRVIAAFVRGQLTVCIFLAVAYAIGLSFTGIDLAVVIGVVSGFAFVIPYAGTVLGIVAGSAMAIAKFGIVDPDFALRIEPHLLGVWAVFGVVQLLESNVISPKIVGEQVGLHPVVMITAVIVGGQLFGFLGILLAVPATAAAAVFWWAGWDRYKRTDFYLARR